MQKYKFHKNWGPPSPPTPYLGAPKAIHLFEVNKIGKLRYNLHFLHTNRHYLSNILAIFFTKIYSPLPFLGGPQIFKFQNLTKILILVKVLWIFFHYTSKPISIDPPNKIILISITSPLPGGANFWKIQLFCLLLFFLRFKNWISKPDPPECKNISFIKI